MLILFLLQNIIAFSVEQNIPRILIAQRTITSPISPLGPDSVFFEKIFRERAIPIMVKNSFEEKSYHEASNDNEIKHVYKNRRSLVDRVNGTLEENKPVDHHPIPRRITFGIFERARNTLESEKKKSKKQTNKHPWLRFVLFTLAIIISACVGYQCGKVHESQNYHKKEEKKFIQEIMNFRGQREIEDYRANYNQLYAEDIHNNYSKAAQYMGESGNFQNGIFINPKQLYWIKKRKLRRELLDSIMVQQSNNYMHESRHRHAMKRLRAPSGRFLTKEEMAEVKVKKKDEQSNGNHNFV